MSGLSYLSGYGSSSEESDSDLEKTVRSLLPLPDLSKVSVIKTAEHVDDPDLHGGRHRAFPHVRGNWATFVYVKYQRDVFINNIIEKLEKKVCLSAPWQRCEDLHISLSKTIVLNYHLIVPFTNSLQSVLNNTESFDLAFDAVEVFCNEENSRTFISLEVDYFCKKFLTSLTGKIDEVLVDFKLPTFYEDPSFHMSILWINGNRKSEIASLLDELNEILKQEIVKAYKTVPVDKVICKSGNKYFQYHLV